MKRKKKKIVIILLAVAALLIVGVVVQPYRIYMAPIQDVNIRWDKSWSSQYSLHFVSGEPSTCDKYFCCYITRLGNTIKIMVLNTRHRFGPCFFKYSYVEHTIPLGNCFIPGVPYTVVVNGVVETFVAGEVSSDKGVVR